eukprot:maker-scaffold340_size202118-snap-gene-0.18 protein:Tk00668 transcript:maker-scaffold340_size202118-snap-gene-0.18-mRNA-1 annotation:"protein farnesyltransferase subunit beta"
MPTTRSAAEIRDQACRDESLPTVTSVEQRAVEASCLRKFEQALSASAWVGLKREATQTFCQRGLRELADSYACFDASRPWLVYWTLHALELMDVTVPATVAAAAVAFLASCQNPNGGFGGGPGQMSHLAPTYAAVNALAIIGTESAFKVINRERLASWLNTLRLEDGSLVMHQDGEVDIRGCYCALSVASLTNVYSPEMFHNTEHWLMRCQTYEGGFGGAPGMEAHGGYSFCGLAALVFLGKERLCNEDRLLRWASSRQMRLEGGFQGRTNKLVDGCYSFWQGGLFPILHKIISRRSKRSDLPNPQTASSPGNDQENPALPTNGWLFHQEALQEYLLLCCQEPRGGLVDKPGKARDFYHTCYCLSGLSVAQHGPNGTRLVLGSQPETSLMEVHPLYNIGMKAAYKASEYFEKLEVPQI